jgi:tetratricopeptide (TPR) repeat protein
MHRLSYQRNQQAYELEQNEYVENAIELYKSIINNKNLDMNSASMPFDRLTIIYRRRKQYDEEIEVIEKWIELTKQSPLYEEKKNVELDKLNLRLEKAKLLKEKNK